MRKVWDFLGTTFLGGVLVLLPLAILIYLFQLILSLLLKISEPLAKLFPSIWNEILVQLIALAILVGICFFVGLFIRTRFGNTVFGFLESQFLAKIPFYTSIKETIQQFTGQKKMPFSEVVLVNAFGNETWMTGFVTDRLPNGYITVFVPTAPNPTNGYVFHLKEEHVKPIDVKSEEAIKSIISMGSGSKKILTKKYFQ